MNIRDINIRDPYIMLHEGKYYLYGTRSDACWGPAEGYDCFVSSDLEEWDGPIEIFHRSEDFFSDHCFWAPECIAYHGAFYLITTFGLEGNSKGIFVMKADRPEGPFSLCGEQLTPKDWVCIDGTVFFEKEDEPVLFFSHSFEDSPTGDMCFVRLSADLSHAVGDPVKVFEAAEAPWANPVPFAKEEFGMDGYVYFTDGPCVMRMDDGKLYMTWSSWGTAGYAVGVAVSESGDIKGPWRQLPVPIYPVNGGHGMMFKDCDGTFKFTLHYPNDKYAERPQIYGIEKQGDTLVLTDRTK